MGITNLMLYCLIAEGILSVGSLVAIFWLKKRQDATDKTLRILQEKNNALENTCKEQEERRQAFEARQNSALKLAEQKREDFQNQQIAAFENFSLTLKQQMFIHESQLLSEHGQWCLEHNGEKKFFKPGKIEKVISNPTQEESSFQYTQDSIVCTVAQGGMVKSELVFSLGGTPKSGKLFEDGNLVKSFIYNEMGQVIPAPREGEE